MSGNIRVIRHDNRELFTSFKEWIECEEDSRAAYVDWLLRDHSDNPDLGIQFSRSREGRGFWWRTSDKSWTTWGKPFDLMDRIQQRCVILALENIYSIHSFMSRLHRSQWNIHVGPDTPDQACAVYFSQRDKPINSSWGPPHDLLRHLPEVLPKFRSFLRFFAMPVRNSESMLEVWCASRSAYHRARQRQGRCGRLRGRRGNPDERRAERLPVGPQEPVSGPLFLAPICVESWNE